MMQKILSFLAATAAILSGCVETIDLSTLNGTPSGRLVVEGLITDEPRHQFIKLTRTQAAIPDGPAETVSGATLSISQGPTVYTLHELDTLPGTYTTDEILQGEIGKTYTLLINHAGQPYTATSTMPPPPIFTPATDLFRTPNRLDNPIPNNLTIYDLEFPKVRYGVAQPARTVYYATDPVDSTRRTATHYEFPGVDPQGFLLNFQGYNPRIVITEGTESCNKNTPSRPGTMNSPAPALPKPISKAASLTV